jgi:hypothetical protein
MVESNETIKSVKRLVMHEWKSQERLIDELDRTDPDLDPLNYKIYLYEKNEWDNVPSVIPAFSFHI